VQIDLGLLLLRTLAMQITAQLAFQGLGRTHLGGAFQFQRLVEFFQRFFMAPEAG
jgi:hypothetical protein